MHEYENCLKRLLQQEFVQFEKTELYGDTYAFTLSPEPCFSKLPHKPYRVYYIWHPDFFGFHIRFQKFSRGGFRTILDPKRENSLFYECFSLAWTQELKNKDIPEGGAKAVLFVRKPEKKEECQRAFIRALLKLSQQCDDTLFLGPDEGISQEIVDWIATLSQEIQYPVGRAVISGKSRAGIGHKEYGVTSHGCIAALEEVLSFLGINPHKDSFSIKMTGGPDGDVAGNFLRIILEKYPNTCKIVAIKDVSGLIHDPKGLDRTLLLDLVRQGRKVSSSNRPLSEDDIHALEADIFFPAGGAPNTLNENNVQLFSPKTRAIIEGANVYLIQKARLFLEEKGVIIIKDQVANKGGVIASSFEVLANLVLSDDQFEAQKPQIVAAVLERIQFFVREEVRFLLKSHQETQKPCSLIANECSEQASKLFSLEVKNGPIAPYLPPIFQTFPLEKLPDWYVQSFLKKIGAKKITYLPLPSSRQRCPS